MKSFIPIEAVYIANDSQVIFWYEELMEDKTRIAKVQMLGQLL